MKKLLGILAISALAASAFAQGTVVLANQTGLVKQWTTATDSTVISVPKGTGYVELFAAPKGTALPNPLFNAALGVMHYDSLAGFLAANPGWALPVNSAGPGTPGLIGLGNGLFAGGNYTIANIGPGAQADYFLLGWNGNFTTADAAIAAWKGGLNMFAESAIFTTATGDPGLTPPGVPVSLKTTFQGMTLIPVVPEPTSFALAGLGLAALLVFRRRS